MNPELRELLKQVATKLTEFVNPTAADADKRRGEVLDTIRKEHHDVLWQPIANVGFAAGRSARDPEVVDLTSKLTAEQQRAAGLATEMQSFREKHKDIAAVQDEAAKKIQAAEQRAKDVETAATARVETALRDRDVTAYESKLVAKGMDANYAKAEGILLRERMKYVDGKLTVMQPGTANIPYTVHDDDLIGVLSDEVIKKAPATAMTSQVDQGGGTGGNGGNGGGGGGGGGFWKGIQEQEKKRSEAGGQRQDVAAAYGRGGKK